MGRKKIQIKPITDDKTRKVTFTRRRNGIFKKAYELGILCDTEVVVLMFDHKQMCHVYSSVEPNQNAPHALVQKYLAKDFATVDPIRNFETSPAIGSEDPTQPIWRVPRERVAVVNTYAVVPASNTPNIGGQASAGEEEDDVDLDGSEQLSVKSVRTYHTKTGEAKGHAAAAAAAMMNTPALTEGAHSPAGKRSMSPDARIRPSPYVAQGPSHAAYAAQQQQQHGPGGQQGLGISGSGFTPLLKPGEQFGNLLYPAQPGSSQIQQGYWPTPSMLSPEQYWVAQQSPGRGQPQQAYFAGAGGYAYSPGGMHAHQQQPQQVGEPMRYSAYDTPQLNAYDSGAPSQRSPGQMLHPASSPAVVHAPVLRAPTARQPASFNNFTYPPPQPSSQQRPTGPTSAPRQSHFHTEPGSRSRQRRQLSDAQSDISSGCEDEREMVPAPVYGLQHYAYSSPVRVQDHAPVTFLNATPRTAAAQMQARYQQQPQVSPNRADTTQLSPKKQKTSRTGSVPVSPRKPARVSPPGQQQPVHADALDGPTLSPPRRVTRSQSRSPEPKARTLPAMTRTTSSGSGRTVHHDKENDEPAASPGKDSHPVSLSVPMPVPPSNPGVARLKQSRNLHLRGPSLMDDITFDPMTGAPMMDPAVLNTWLGGPSGPTTPVPAGEGAADNNKGLLGFRQQETSHVRAESNVSVSQWIHMPTVQE